MQQKQTIPVSRAYSRSGGFITQACWYSHHTRVARIVHEHDTEMPAGVRPCAGELDVSQLPDSMRERLLAAARINALTEIETLIGELKVLGTGAHRRAPGVWRSWLIDVR